MRRSARQELVLEPLAGRTILVSGGGTGMGAAICHELAVHGARVALLDRDGAAASATARRIDAIGAHALAIVGDAAREHDTHRAVTIAREAFGCLDAVVACCRSRPSAPLEELDAEDWDRGMPAAMRGMFLVSRFALPALKQRGFGNIVCAWESETIAGVEAAARAERWAILGFCDALRASQAQHRIRVSAVVAGALADARCAPPDLEVAYVDDALEAAAAVREELSEPRLPLAVGHPLGAMGQAARS